MILNLLKSIQEAVAAEETCAKEILKSNVSFSANIYKMLILYENCSNTFFVNNRVQLRRAFQNNFRTLLDTRSPQVTTIIWLTAEFYVYVLINIFLGVMSRRRCGVCDNCKQADCGLCMYCRDKPRFGGPGRLKQSCLKRKCIRLSSSSKQLTGKQWVALCYKAISH